MRNSASYSVLREFESRLGDLLFTTVFSTRRQLTHGTACRQQPAQIYSLLLSTLTHELYRLTLQKVHNLTCSLDSELKSPLEKTGLNVHYYPVNNKTHTSRTRHYFCEHGRHKRIIFKKDEKVWIGLIWYNNYSAIMMFRFFNPVLTRAPLSVYSYGPLISCSVQLLDPVINWNIQI